MKHIWLFRFTSYSYCQGTRDTQYGDLRLLYMTLPCDEVEAKYHLIRKLNDENVEFDPESIENLSISITNS